MKTPPAASLFLGSWGLVSVVCEEIPSGIDRWLLQLIG